MKKLLYVIWFLFTPIEKRRDYHLSKIIKIRVLYADIFSEVPELPKVYVQRGWTATRASSTRSTRNGFAVPYTTKTAVGVDPKKERDGCSC